MADGVHHLRVVERFLADARDHAQVHRLLGQEGDAEEKDRCW
jgi:hypothetical protein